MFSKLALLTIASMAIFVTASPSPSFGGLPMPGPFGGDSSAPHANTKSPTGSLAAKAKEAAPVPMPQVKETPKSNKDGKDGNKDGGKNGKDGNKDGNKFNYKDGKGKNAPKTMDAGTCNTGPVQCCDATYESNSHEANMFQGIMGDIAQGPDTLMASSCSPMGAGGAAGTCTAQTVCCKDNSFKGFVAFGCTPINVYVPGG
ncbi:hypothetical protein GALMADRAFT_148333 [Galerina marginata CBS 339.88]|uniref:Hydrophobin n=1 Tax=Galerina marginata (strain CBS 339.88) TaxID=685588 RepID=A0A067SDJ9_GALM3|nr:hypothetical protein GALMADRAFT_148333 [Galerina marginata CBS 339.88]